MNKLRESKILGGVGLLCLFLGVVTPYYELNILGYSMDLTLNDYVEGKIIMFLIAINLLFIFRNIIEKIVPQVFNKGIGLIVKNANEKLSIIPTFCVVALAIYIYTQTGIEHSEYLHYCFGFYSFWIGVFCLLVYSFVYKKSDNVVNVENENVYQQNISENIEQIPNDNINQIGQNQDSTVYFQSNQVSQNNTFINDQNLNQTQTTFFNEQPIQSNNNMSVEQGTNVTTEQNVRICPNCGNQCNPTMTQCFMCGHKFN